MITFSDVSFTYTGDSYVLQDLNLTIEKGQFVCVLGANGSGKSTFSKLINALLLPDKGTVTTKGMDTSDPEYTFLIRSSAGSVFQNPDDQFVASLVENDVAFGPENLGIENPELRTRNQGTRAGWAFRIRTPRNHSTFGWAKTARCYRRHSSHEPRDSYFG